jgi:hypothetical protein
MRSLRSADFRNSRLQRSIMKLSWFWSLATLHIDLMITENATLDT